MGGNSLKESDRTREKFKLNLYPGVRIFLELNTEIVTNTGAFLTFISLYSLNTLFILLVSALKVCGHNLEVV